MKVYFLRHGKADRAEWRGDDDARPLTAEGEEAMRREAKALRAVELELDVIVTSPLARARRTAETVAHELGLGGRLVEDADSLTDSTCAAWSSSWRSTHRRGRPMVVGHEPDFSATVAELIGGGDARDAEGRARTCGRDRARGRRRAACVAVDAASLGSR